MGCELSRCVADPDAEDLPREISIDSLLSRDKPLNFSHFRNVLFSSSRTGRYVRFVEETEEKPQVQNSKGIDVNKIIVSITAFSLGMIMAQQCPAQITITSSHVIIKGNDGDNKVNISSLANTWGPGWFIVSLRRGYGDWQTRPFHDNRGNMYIDCDLGPGSNNFSNRTTLGSTIKVSGNGTNVIFCGDGEDLFISTGNSRDLVYGGGGNDSIYAGDGWDWVLGEEGDDVICDSLLGLHFSAPGGDGKVDWLSGGGGSDTFVIGPEDRITDLSTEDGIYNGY